MVDVCPLNRRYRDLPGRCFDDEKVETLQFVVDFGRWLEREMCDVGIDDRTTEATMMMERWR